MDYYGKKSGYFKDVEVGKSDGSLGGNQTIYATLTSIFTFSEANVNEDDATWTMTGTGPLVHVAGNTTTLTATPSVAIEVGRTYKVTITGTGGGGTATYTLGGVTGTTIAASGAIAITDWITASTTGNLIITPASACTVSITNITIERLEDATGDLTVQGDLAVRSQMFGMYTGPAYPSYSFLNDSDTGMYSAGANIIGFASGGAVKLSIGTGVTAYALLSSNTAFSLASNTAYLVFGSSSDLSLNWDAANTLSQRRTTNQQTFRIYNTGDAIGTLTNYERLTLTGVQGASVNVTAESAGTGSPNLDVVLTPKGTGKLRNAVDNITVGAGTGITVVGAGNLNRQLYRVTTSYTAFSDTDTTKGVVIATLPAKMKIVGFYADTTTKYIGGAVSAATLEVGITAEGAAGILAAHDVFSAAITKGLADADMGTGMTRAAQIQGGYLPSWTGTTDIYATIDTTTANTNALTQGSTTFYIETEQY